ncbi:hypothetical protein ACLOAV_003552 [Pseudogymnoascus australis]
MAPWFSPRFREPQELWSVARHSNNIRHDGSRNRREASLHDEVGADGESRLNSQGSSLTTYLKLVIWIGVFLATLSVLLRGYIRRRYSGGFQLDDIFTFLALALLVASAIMYTVIREPMFNLVEISAGIQPMPTTPEAEAKFFSETALYLRMQFAITVAFWSCLWTVKASFLTLFYPLGNGLKLDRMLWYGATIITVIGYIFCVISYPISCTGFNVGDCSSEHNIQLSLLSLKGSTALDIISDLAIIVLPWKLLWVVKRSRAEKIAIGSIVGLGVIIIVFAVVRVIVTNTTRTHPELVWLALWSAIESTIAVIVVSLISLRVYIVKGARTRTGTGTGSGRKGGGYSTPGPGFDSIAGATGPNGGAIQLSESISGVGRNHNGEIKQGSLSNDSDDFLVR